MIFQIPLRPHYPRKRRYAWCSLWRDAKTAVHTTRNGKGATARVYAKGKGR